MNDVLPYHRHQGMFLCLDLSGSSIERLRAEYGIYLLDSGRISIASLGKGDMARFCEILARITREGEHLPNGELLPSIGYGQY